MENQNILFIQDKLHKLAEIISSLEKEYPMRKFTLDGHLFGSIGEVVAKEYYGLDLSANQSLKCHDGIVEDKQVQVKITQRESVDITSQPEYLIVLFLKKPEMVFYEVYNGPGEKVLNQATEGKPRRGFYTKTLRWLYEQSQSVSEDKRIPFKTDQRLEKWTPGIRNK